MRCISFVVSGQVTSEKSFYLEEAEANTVCIMCGKNSGEGLLLITVAEIKLKSLFFSV